MLVLQRVFFWVQGSRAALGKLSISGLWQMGWEEGGLKAAFCQGAVGLQFPFRSVWSRKGRSSKIWGVGERLLDLHRVGS